MDLSYKNILFFALSGYVWSRAGYYLVYSLLLGWDIIGLFAKMVFTFIQDIWNRNIDV